MPVQLRYIALMNNDALPAVWPIRGFRHDVEPTNFMAQLGL
jgi:hypothetical protein